MNIFILSTIAALAAKYLCDKHVVKMVLETTQLLYFVHYIHNNIGNLPPDFKPYKPGKAHLKHPCTIWASQSTGNYIWLCKLGKSLYKEYTFRYGKIHLCTAHIDMLSDNIPSILNKDKTPFAQAVPDKFKCDDALIAYRRYYIEGKVRNIDVRYDKGRDPPNWLVNGLKERILYIALRYKGAFVLNDGIVTMRDDDDNEIIFECNNIKATSSVVNHEIIIGLVIIKGRTSDDLMRLICC